MKKLKKESPIRIAVTGSTGHLGSVLIPMLVDQGYVLNCLYRKNTLSLKSKRINWIQGDLTQDTQIDSVLEGASALIHCASLISIGEAKEQEVYDVNVEGTQRLIEHCLARQIRMIYISSSTATIPDKENRILDADAPFVTSKDLYYSWTKAQAEKLVLNAVKHSGLDALILRPTALIGPPDPQPSRFGRTILDLYNGKLPLISSGGYDLLDIRDFAQTVITSIEKGIKGEAYLTGGRFYTLKELATLVNPKKVPPVVPIEMLLFLLPLIRLYQKFVPLRWPINRESLMTVKLGPKRVDSSKAQAQLDHQSRPLEESIRDLIDWMNNKTSK